MIAVAVYILNLHNLFTFLVSGRITSNKKKYIYQKSKPIPAYRHHCNNKFIKKCPSKQNLYSIHNIKINVTINLSKIYQLIYIGS